MDHENDRRTGAPGMTMPNGECDRDRDRRWAMRRKVEMEVAVTDTEGLSYSATLTDISEDGCMIRLASEQDLVGNRLHTVKIPGARGLAGYVIWCSGGKAGLAFSEPLYPAQVEALVLNSHYTGIARNMAKIGAMEDHLPSLPPFPFEN